MKRMILNRPIRLLFSLLFAASSTLAGEVEDEWQAYLEPWKDVGPRWVKELWLPDDPALRQQLYDVIFTEVSQAYIALQRNDVEHPDFWATWGHIYNVGLPNPDNVYNLAPVDDKGVYRISGFRGSVRILDLSLSGGDIATVGEGQLGRTFANYDFDELKKGKDGYFEVLLSAARPEGYTGDWWKLEPGTTNIMARQLSYDWLKEEDARLAIDRLDTPARRPMPSPERVDANLKQIRVWTENWLKLMFYWANHWKANGYNTGFTVDHYNDSAGLSSQQYVVGAFDLLPDEALILESTLPENCVYWSFQVADELWRTIDPINRQSSLNGHQAVVDADGKFRGIIAANDPGVPNWLDMEGLQRGEVMGRFTKCDGTPTISSKVVKLAELRNHLPEDTPAVTVEEREAVIRLRRKGAQLRRRW